MRPPLQVPAHSLVGVLTPQGGPPPAPPPSKAKQSNRWHTFLPRSNQAYANISFQYNMCTDTSNTNSQAQTPPNTQQGVVALSAEPGLYTSANTKTLNTSLRTHSTRCAHVQLVVQSSYDRAMEPLGLQRLQLDAISRREGIGQRRRICSHPHCVIHTTYTSGRK